MIFLRILLYLICAISIGWSGLVFGGPLIIKRLISSYSDGALIPSGITVTPGLDVNISRLDFIFQDAPAGRQMEGFARATEIEWSLFGDKPFIEINFGPSVLKDHATANSANIYIPSFQEIDWQNIALAGNIENLALNSLAELHSLAFAGNLNLDLAKLLDVSIDAKKIRVTDRGSTYSANLITSKLSELNLNISLREQLLSSTFAIEDIIVSEPKFIVSEAIIESYISEETRNLKIALHDLEVLELGGFIKNVKVDVNFDQQNVLQDLHVGFSHGILLRNLPQLPVVSARITKIGEVRYHAYVEGEFDEFELSYLDNFIGTLPSGNYVIDLNLDRATSLVTSKSRISFDTLGDASIVGSLDVGFISERSTNLGCALGKCELSNFDLAYDIKFDEEWVRGGAHCPISFCGFFDMGHSVRTSNTSSILTILNQANILNPISSLYLYGLISSGKKINGGHELKFQF